MPETHDPAAELWLDADDVDLGRARRVVARTAAQLGADAAAVDAARLLVSELVTNVVLHAGTDALVTVHDASDAVRVVVVDGSATGLQPRRGDIVSTTGRGLRLLDLLGHAHGVDRDDRVAPDGKHVWFTVCKRTPAEHPPPAGRGPSTGPDRGAARPAVVQVRLLGTPVRLWDRSSEHSAELMRELQLLTIGEGSGTTALHLPARLIRLVADLQGRYAGVGDGQRAELEAAWLSGQPTVDLSYDVPAEIGPACRALRELLDEADDYCAQGRRLITLVSPEDQRRFRTWFLEEFVRQCEGEDPQPWSGPVG